MEVRVRVPKHLKDAIEQEALRRDQPTSVILRDALREYLIAEKAMPASLPAKPEEARP